MRRQFLDDFCGAIIYIFKRQKERNLKGNIAMISERRPLTQKFYYRDSTNKEISNKNTLIQN